MKYFSKIAAALFFLFIFQSDSLAFSTAAGDEHNLPWFNESPNLEVWSVTLEMDFDAILKSEANANFFSAKFYFKDTNGHLVNWATKVSIRGRFRRIHCDFPPLKLKFPKKEMKAAGFGKHNDVKLVTHCEINKNAKETLLREFLAYQLYARLTNVSFRTQLLHITYKDSKTGAETDTYGFFIEDTDALAQRMGARRCEGCYNLSGKDFDQKNLQIHDLFQYMISNVDWSLYMIRNLKILTPENESGKKIVVPYDFDFSGLVNARYAIPDPDLDQIRVRDRVYIGSNWTDDQWKETIAIFQEKKQELMKTVDEFNFINDKAKKDIKQFLKRFYSKIDRGFIPKNVYGVQY